LLSTKTEMIRSVLLMSGGVESSVLFHQLQAMGHTVCPVFVDYNQRGRAMELQASRAVVENGSGHARELEVFDLSAVGGIFQGLNKLHIPLPHRNLPLLSLALSWAVATESSSIAIGITKDDVQKGGLNTQTNKTDFLQQFAQIVRTLEPGITTITPQLNLTKPEVIKEGCRYSTLDFSLTYSCMRGRERHCGACMQCHARRAAFIEAGVSEQAGFYER